MSERIESLGKAGRAVDPGALAEALPRYLPRLERFAQRRLRPLLAARESPADIVQSVCREILRSLSSFDDFGAGEAAFRQWLFRTTERKLRDRQRHHLRQKRSVRREAEGEHTSQLASPNVPSPSRAAVADEDRRALHAALDRLPADYREVIQRIHLDGVPTDVVAACVGRSSDAVRSLLARAMARLAAVLRAAARQGIEPRE